MMQDLGRIFGAAESTERCLELINEVSEPAGDYGAQAAALSGLAEGLEARDARRGLMALLSSETAGADAARHRVEAILERSKVLALDQGARPDRRVREILLLGHTDYPNAGATLEKLLAPHHASEIQLAAVRALSRFPDSTAAAVLVQPDRWRTYTPEIRNAVLSALLDSEPHTSVLLDAVETGAIAPTELAPQRRTRLTNHRNPTIQQRARLVFGPVEAGNQMQAYERLRATVAGLRGDAVQGAQVFSSQCAACHTFAGEGGTLGPDVSGIHNQPPDAILLHVLVPDFEITPGYEGYVVETRDGRTLVGRLVSEAPNSITLRDLSSREHVILRTQLVSVAVSRTSLMPAGIDQALSAQDLANLIQYLKSEPREGARR